MKKRILVADDDENQRNLYVDIFTEKGFEAISAEDGLEALNLALEKIPDLVFTGIIMPKMDGFELVRNLRANVATAHTPVMMFSHLGREEDRVRAAKLQNVVFLVKGMDSPAEIVRKVDDLIG